MILESRDFPTQPTGGRVYRKGFPIIQFQIANQDKLLNPQTLRLTGSLQLKTATGTHGGVERPDGGSQRHGIRLNHREQPPRRFLDARGHLGHAAKGPERDRGWS